MNISWRKFFDVFFCIVMIFSFFCIWAFKMLFVSDVPVNISKIEFVILIILIVVWAIIFNIYSKYSKLPIINGILLISMLLLWMIELVDSLKYNRSIFDTYLNIVGVTISSLSLIYLIYRFKKIKSQ